MMKVYLTAGQAACIFMQLSKKHLDRAVTYQDLIFAQKFKNGYKAASTFGDFVDANHINLIES